MKSYLVRYHGQSAANSSPILRSILVYLAGMLLGYLCGHVLRNSLYTTVKDTYEGLLSGIVTTKIKFLPFCLLCFKQQCKEYVLLIFFSCTNVWLLYLYGYLLYSGFTNGLLLLFCTILHGVSGIWGYFCFLMPQALIYVPLYLLLIQKLHTTHADTKKGISLLHEIPFLLLLLLLLLVGCILESTLNLPLLRWYHGL
ncbi:MAG: stage II sporulation protein M [Eubacteriales bacterium]|nr:stage II sporulation protein M [Eubacteriales bacterium]